MRKNLLGIAVALGLVLGAAAPAWAEVKPERAKDELAKVQEKLTDQQEAKAALEQKARAASGEIEGLSAKLIAATRALQDKEEEQDALEEHLDDLEQKIALSQAGFDAARHRLAELTKALLRLARLPPEAFFLREGVSRDTLHLGILLRALLPELTNEASQLRRHLERLAELKGGAAGQRRLLLASRQNLAWQRHQLDQMIAARQGALQKTTAQKEALEKEMTALAEEAQDLKELLAKAERAAAAASKNKALEAGAPNLKAGLKLPVAGKLIRAFGARDADGISSKGLTFAAEPGARVAAPLKGRVIFAGPFKGYGRIVILRHAGGSHSFLAGFGLMDADVGQTVEAGEPLGQLPETTKDGSKARPELYYEWRLNGEPVDPLGQMGKK